MGPKKNQKSGEIEKSSAFFSPPPPPTMVGWGAGLAPGPLRGLPPRALYIICTNGRDFNPAKKWLETQLFWVGGTEVLAERANILCKVANPAGIFDDQKNAILIQG